MKIIKWITVLSICTLLSVVYVMMTTVHSEDSIRNSLNASVGNNIKLEKIIDIDNKKIVLFSGKKALGVVIYKESIAGRYSIDVKPLYYSEISKTIINNYVIATNKSNYVFMYGYNESGEIHKVIINTHSEFEGISDEKIELNIPTQRCFILFKAITGKVKNIRVYNDKNVDITERYGSKTTT